MNEGLIAQNRPLRRQGASLRDEKRCFLNFTTSASPLPLGIHLRMNERIPNNHKAVTVRCEHLSTFKVRNSIRIYALTFRNACNGKNGEKSPGVGKNLNSPWAWQIFKLDAKNGSLESED